MGKFPIQLCLYGLCQGLIGRQASYTRGQTGEVGVRAYLYNGVKLPDINSVYTPELQKTHPYAVIVKGRTRYLSKDEGLDANYDGSEYELVVTDKPLTFSESVGAIWYNINDSAYDTAATGMYSYLKKDGEMVVPPVWNNTNNTFYNVSGIPVWSNYTLTNETDLTLPAPSDPVPLYSYNGVELPELPEGYQFATLKQQDTDSFFSGGKTAVLYFSNQPITKTGTMFTDSKLVISGGHKEYLLVNDLELVGILGGDYSSISEANKWTLVETGESTSVMLAGDDYDWSNHDILDDDDAVYLAGSEPQPVYM